MIQVIDKSGFILNWVNTLVGLPVEREGSVTFGFLTDDKKTLAGGIVLYNYRKTDMMLSSAIANPLVLRPQNLEPVSDYIFNTCGCDRLTSVVRITNEPSLKLTRHLGFKEEGHLRRVFDGDDAKLFGMLKEECRWLKPASEELEPSDG